MFTNDKLIAEKIYLIRNHGEAVVEKKGTQDLTNIIGHNFRLGEIEASIGIEQLKKLKDIISRRQEIARIFDSRLKKLDGLEIPKVRSCSHVYYMYQMKVDEKVIGVSRKNLLKALEAEGLEGLSTSYANIHLLPIFQKKIA